MAYSDKFEREMINREKDRLKVEKDRLKVEKDWLKVERDRLKVEKERLEVEKEMLEVEMWQGLQWARYLEDQEMEEEWRKKLGVEARWVPRD